ncbi:MAG: hypothetical protein GXP30_13515 [Verrucomicrobia bacterium]|nr:hypothetical protein [Verrucomicrobiota bacterium]
MKKFALIFTGGAILLVIVLLVVRHLAIGFLTPDYLVQEIEKRWTCRAEVEGLKVSLWGKTGLELKGVRLGPVDEYVQKGTALKDRPPMEHVEVSADLALIEVEVKDLLQRRIKINQLLVKDVMIETRIRRNGQSSVQDLFQPPTATATAAEPKKVTESEPKKVSATKAKPKAKVKPKPKAEEKGDMIVVSIGGNEIEMPAKDGSREKSDQKEFSAEDLQVSAFADNVEIQNAQIIAKLESGSSVITLSNLQLKLSQIEIDPNDLLKHNHAAFSFSGDLAVENSKTNNKQLSVSLSGDGEVQPFDPTSGRIDPRWVSNLTVKKGSAINTFPMIDKLKKLLSGVDTAGVNLEDLHINGELKQDASTRIAGHAGRLELKKNLALPLKDTDFVFVAGSWLDSGANQHHLRGSVVASDELTAKLSGKVDKYLKKKAKNFYSDSLKDLVLQPAMKDGHIAFDFVSKGNMGDPKVDILTPFGNLSELLDQGKETIETLKEVGKSLLKGLFGK